MSKVATQGPQSVLIRSYIGATIIPIETIPIAEPGYQRDYANKETSVTLNILEVVIKALFL